MDMTMSSIRANRVEVVTSVQRRRRKGLDQASQLRPRHNKIHLVEKLTLACSLGDQFKSGGE
jgi:hypothetical protein